MHNFCTLFDSNYLTRGLTLYDSLIDTGETFHLFIFCFDDTSYEILRKLDLQHVELVKLSDFETPELVAVKQERSKAEYCWTCTPHVIRYALDTYLLKQITYLDADLYFFQKPSVLINEFDKSGCSVLITEHRYTPKYDQSATSGIYCVQFMTFNSDDQALKILQWWQDRCLEWCFGRVEDGKFGDQKYLDDWTARFEGVHVLEHLGGGLAPWNIQQYNIFRRNNVLSAIEKNTGKEFEIVFYHFHNLAIYTNNYIDLSSYELPRDAVELIYKHYIRHLDIKEKEIQLRCSFNPNILSSIRYDWKMQLNNLKRIRTKNYNIYNKTKFLEY